MLSFLRHYHKWLETFGAHQIPISAFDISYSRSSGPGGQKVNKTSSKATVSMPAERWLHPHHCEWIPEDVRAQLASNKIRYEQKNGGVVVQSDSSRNRETNTRECFRKLLAEIKAAVVVEGETSEEDLRKWAKVKAATNEARLRDKKRKGEKKGLRKKLE